MRVGIAILSDRCRAGERDDLCGPLLEEMVLREGWELGERKLLPDGREPLGSVLRDWADRAGFDVILTSGGTGLSPRDLTPEATREALEREVPGIPEALRAASASKTAALSRMAAGLRGKTLIVNLPGSPRAVRECWEILSRILPHAVAVSSGAGADCGRDNGEEGNG